jgi:membrane protein DedA with SNARE-associated domain
MLEGLPFPVAVGVLFVIVMLRANATYWIGRGAETGAERTRLSGLLNSPRFRRAQRIVARWGAPIVTVSFLTVGIQTLVNLAAGVARMPLRRYLPAVTIGCVLWALLYATVGFVTVTAWLRLYELSPVAAIVVTVALLAGLAVFVWSQVRRGRLEREDKESNSGPHRVAAHD